MATRTRVAFLGPLGTHSHQAAAAHFAAAAGLALAPAPTIAAAAQALFADAAAPGSDSAMPGPADYAILPLENSTAGPVAETAAVLAQHKDHVCALPSVTLDITHCVTARRLDSPGTRAITSIVSHEQALAQCKHSLRRLYANVPVRPVRSTALAATIARDDLTGSTLAICSPFAASSQGVDPEGQLDILHHAIQDAGVANRTTFIVLTKRQRQASCKQNTFAPPPLST